MVSNRNFLVFAVTFIVLGCDPSNKESTGAVFCTIDQTETYELGTNPTVDFNQVNVLKTTNFNSVTCPDVNDEPIANLISRVKRQDGQVQIIENQFTGGDFTLQLQVSGTDLIETSSAFTKNRCTVKRFWSGQLNSPVNGITVNETIVYRGNCAPVFLDQRSF